MNVLLEIILYGVASALFVLCIYFINKHINGKSSWWLWLGRIIGILAYVPLIVNAVYFFSGIKAVWTFSLIWWPVLFITYLSCVLFFDIKKSDKNFSLLMVGLLLLIPLVINFHFVFYFLLVKNEIWYLILNCCIFLVFLLAFFDATMTKKISNFFSNEEEQRTEELLTIHSQICPEITFNMNEATIVFFSDLHRGMGDRDAFKPNIDLFKKILQHYADEKFTMVYIGDSEEGWGFQGSNIPLILNWHKKEFDLEKEFMKDNRLYRIYGNHDDRYRGNYLPVDYCMGLDETFSPDRLKVYPAIKMTLNPPAGKNLAPIKMFITHGCQGQALEDAGDELAAWAVFSRYNWWLRSSPHYIDIKKHDKFKKHEEYVYRWAEKKKEYDILIAGHTHIPAFMSRLAIAETLALIPGIDSDKKEENLSFFNYRSVSKTKPSRSKIKKIRSAILRVKRTVGDGKKKPEKPYYFNTGCGLFNKTISCIEINKGLIHLYFISENADGSLVFTDVDVQGSPAELENLA